MADATVRDLLGGGLRPNDPRRFLLEAMIGAMNADGVIDVRERAVLDRHVRAHQLFAGMSPEQAGMLVDLANDAVRIAGATARAPAIARGLPARWHRLAAYGMAMEVCAADQRVVAAEQAYMEELRIALRIGSHEADAVVAAANAGAIGRYLDDRLHRLRALIPTAAAIFAVRALAKGALTDGERARVRAYFAAVPDLALAADELEVELYRAFRRAELADSPNVYGALADLALGLVDPIDRYWMMVYALVAELPATVASWRIIPFIGLLQTAFGLGDADMQLAVVDALSFAPALPRPS
jgi:hypothetical protein